MIEAFVCGLTHIATMRLRCYALILIAFSGFHAPATAQQLTDFGYKRLTVNGTTASGARPLLVVLQQFSSDPKIGTVKPLAHSTTYYDQLIFNTFNQPRSVNGYFSENSHGRFFWTRAGKGTYGPYKIAGNLYDYDNIHPNKARGQLFEALKSVAAEGFNFAQYDKNKDGIVTQDELTVLVIDNASGITGAANRSTFPSTFTPPGQNVTVQLVMITIGDVASFMSFVHELCHQLGTIEMYGDDGGRNYRYTTMGATISNIPDDMTTFHLDLWDKMLLGWIEPRFYSLDTDGSATITAAQLSQGVPALILYSPAHGTKEFYLLEFRTASLQPNAGYDANLNGAGNTPESRNANTGVVIWHVQTKGLGGENIGADISIIKSLTTPNVNLISVFMNGAPNFSWGEGNPWQSGMTTPFKLNWLDGTGRAADVTVGALSPDGKTIQVSWSGPSQQDPQSHPFPVSVMANDIYAVTSNGNVLQYRHLDGNVPPFGPLATRNWAGPTSVDNWAKYKIVIPAGGFGRFYAMTPTGNLIELEHTGRDAGSNVWKTKQVGNGWNMYSSLIGGSNGVVNGLEKTLNKWRMYWYKHNGFDSLGGVETWTPRVEEGAVLAGFRQVISAGKGVYYGLLSNGDLLHIRHLGYADGSVNWTKPVRVGNGWQAYTQLFGAGNGVIYAIKPDGTLDWWRHNTWDADQPTFNWSGPVPVGNGWHFTTVLAPLPDTTSPLVR